MDIVYRTMNISQSSKAYTKFELWIMKLVSFLKLKLTTVVGKIIV